MLPELLRDWSRFLGIEQNLKLNNINLAFGGRLSRNVVGRVGDGLGRRRYQGCGRGANDEFDDARGDGFRPVLQKLSRFLRYLWGREKGTVLFWCAELCQANSCEL